MMGATGVSERRTLEIEFQCLTLTQLVDDAIYFAFCCRGVAMFRSNFFVMHPNSRMLPSVIRGRVLGVANPRVSERGCYAKSKTANEARLFLPGLRVVPPTM